MKPGLVDAVEVEEQLAEQEFGGSTLSLRNCRVSCVGRNLKDLVPTPLPPAGTPSTTQCFRFMLSGSCHS